MTIQAIRQIIAKTAAENRNSRANSLSQRALSALPLEERQALLVELGDAFVDWRVRAAFENRKLAALDAVLHRVGEAGRRHHIVAAERNLCRRLDLRERRERIVV